MAGVIPVKLLTKSASITGFFLMHYPQYWIEAFAGLTQLIKENKLISKIDNGPGK